MVEKSPIRGQDTRTRLLETATHLFSERGFDGVSTREIAGAVGATLPSIAHHFGSKAGLYQAVLQGIADEMSDKLALAATQAAAVLADAAANRDQQLDALLHLLTNHAWVILYSRPEWARLMEQEQAHPSGAFTPVNAALETQLLNPLICLVARLRGLPPEGEAVKLQAFFLVGRVLIFRTVRASALDMLGWPTFTPDRIGFLIDRLEIEVRLLFAPSCPTSQQASEATS